MPDARRAALRRWSARPATAGRYQALHWEGSFRDYLAIVERNPAVARNAWQRLLDMIESHGSSARGDARRGRRAGRSSTIPFGGGRDAVYGLDEPLDAAGADDPRRRARPRARAARDPAARSGGLGQEHDRAPAEARPRGLLADDAGALYTFDWDVDGEVDALADEPGSAAAGPARGARARSSERLNSGCAREYRLRDPGRARPGQPLLLPHADASATTATGRKVDRARARAALRAVREGPRRHRHVPAQGREEPGLDRADRRPQLPARSPSTARDSDPRAFNFDGEFNVANRGLLEFVEVLKLDVAFLYDLLGATQEHCDQAQEVRADAHRRGDHRAHERARVQASSQSNELMEAFRDRTIKIDMPYNLSRRRRGARSTGASSARASIAGRARSRRTRSRSRRCGRC